MPQADQFSYKGLFAKSAPKDPPRAASVERAKYDFAVAYPDPDSLPLEDLGDSLKSALAEEGRGLAVYPHQQGYPPLREYVASKLARDREIRVDADEIVLADGSSQPLHMVGETLLDPGDVVLTEEFVYVGYARHAETLFRRTSGESNATRTGSSPMRWRARSPGQ